MSMICQKCGNTEVCEDTISYQMECRNNLFCFEEVPAPKCPECGNFVITEEALVIMLAKIEQLTQKATISYHRCRWPKTPVSEDHGDSQAAAELMETINKSTRK